VNKRYYKKKGASFKEKLRCPLCGKLSPIGYFNINHQFGVYRQWFYGKGDIRWFFVKKTIEFMDTLKESIVNRLLELLYHFTNQRYYSQFELDIIIQDYEKKLATHTLICTPRTIPTIRTVIKPNIIPNKVVID